MLYTTHVLLPFMVKITLNKIIYVHSWSKLDLADSLHKKNIAPVNKINRELTGCKKLRHVKIGAIFNTLEASVFCSKYFGKKHLRRRQDIPRKVFNAFLPTVVLNTHRKQSIRLSLC